MQPQPLIAVADVEASSRWYQQLLGAVSAHGGREYERLTIDDRIVLQLHDWHAHGHQYLGDPSIPNGNGLLLWFQVDDFDDSVARARSLGVTFLEGPHYNAGAQHREFWIHDPDGYVIVLSGPQFEPQPETGEGMDHE